MHKSHNKNACSDFQALSGLIIFVDWSTIISERITKYLWIDSSTSYYHFTTIERVNSICKTLHISLAEVLHQNYILLIKINVSPSTLNEAGWESAILTCSGWLSVRARYSWTAALRTLWTSSLSLHTSGRVGSERCSPSSRHHNPAAARQEAQAWGNEQHRFTNQIRVCEKTSLIINLCVAYLFSEGSYTPLSPATDSSDTADVTPAFFDPGADTLVCITESSSTEKGRVEMWECVTLERF